jgi:hypothetical protein
MSSACSFSWGVISSISDSPYLIIFLMSYSVRIVGVFNKSLYSPEYATSARGVVGIITGVFPSGLIVP